MEVIELGGMIGGGGRIGMEVRELWEKEGEGVRRERRGWGDECDREVEPVACDVTDDVI